MSVEEEEEVDAEEDDDDGDEGGDAVGNGNELELDGAALLREKAFRVAIQYKSWVLLKPGSSLGLDTSNACVHAAFGSLIARFAIT